MRYWSSLRFWIRAWTAKTSVCMCAGWYSRGENVTVCEGGGAEGKPTDISVSITMYCLNEHTVLLLLQAVNHVFDIPCAFYSLSISATDHENLFWQLPHYGHLELLTVGVERQNQQCFRPIEKPRKTLNIFSNPHLLQLGFQSFKAYWDTFPSRAIACLLFSISIS